MQPKEENKNEEASPEESSTFDLQEHMKIFLQKEEDLFERYGDEEAALYEQMVQMDQSHQQHTP